MAESGLSLSYNDLAGETGLFLGFGRGAPFGDATWTTQQKNAIDSCVKSGLRQFYFPEPEMDGIASHDWSFLKPVANLDLPKGAKAIPLPDDFGGIEGGFTILSSSQVTWWRIPVMNPGQVREVQSITPLASGRPRMTAVEWLKATGASQGQRANLLVYPNADIEYTMQVTYYILPDYLSAAIPYAYGGAAHAETIRASCLMAAEEFLDNTRGVWAEKFRVRLSASIQMDRKTKPQELGYNGDMSDLKDRRYPTWRPDQHGWSLVTYKGQQY